MSIQTSDLNLGSMKRFNVSFCNILIKFKLYVNIK